MDQDQRLVQAAELLKTLGNYNRLRIIILLSEQGSLNVSTMLAQLPLEKSLLSKYLTKMKDKKILVIVHRRKEIYYSLSDPTLGCIVTLLLSRLAK